MILLRCITLLPFDLNQNGTLSIVQLSFQEAIETDSKNFASTCLHSVQHSSSYYNSLLCQHWSYLLSTEVTDVSYLFIRYMHTFLKPRQGLKEEANSQKGNNFKGVLSLLTFSISFYIIYNYMYEGLDPNRKSSINPGDVCEQQSTFTSGQRVRSRCN